MSVGFGGWLFDAGGTGAFEVSEFIFECRHMIMVLLFESVEVIGGDRCGRTE